MTGSKKRRSPLSLAPRQSTQIVTRSINELVVKCASDDALGVSSINLSYSNSGTKRLTQDQSLIPSSPLMLQGCPLHAPGKVNDTQVKNSFRKRDQNEPSPPLPVPETPTELLDIGRFISSSHSPE